MPNQLITPVSLDLPSELDPPHQMAQNTKDAPIPVILDPWPASIDNDMTADDCSRDDFNSIQLKLIQEAITLY